MIVRADAIDDIDEIWSFGYERWGEAHADRYSDRLITDMNRLLDHPEIGPQLFGRSKDLRSLKSGKHRIVYGIDGNDISIVRILHSSQDFGRHLP